MKELIGLAMALIITLAILSQYPHANPIGAVCLFFLVLIGVSIFINPSSTRQR